MTKSSLQLGDQFASVLTLSEEQIIAGARFLGDRNPIHNDLVAAAASRFGRLIACGPHISGIHACMLPSHFTDLGFNVVGTVFTVRYRAPVFADTAHEFAWTISAIASNRTSGELVDLTGTVTSQTSERDETVCIEATGQILMWRSLELV